MTEEVLKIHESKYDSTPKALYFAPGRVNLIGEHTDYSGGYVFPAAIDLGIYGAFSHRRDLWRFLSSIG